MLTTNWWLPDAHLVFGLCHKNIIKTVSELIMKNMKSQNENKFIDSGISGAQLKIDHNTRN